MVKYLEADYDIEGPAQGLIPHFWTTIDAIGGWYGFIGIFIGCLGFYIIVNYVIQRDRAKREAKVSRKRI